MDPFNSQQLFWVTVPDLAPVVEQVAVHFQTSGFHVQTHPVSATAVYVYLIRPTNQAFQQPKPELMIYIEGRGNHTVVQAGAASGNVGLKVWKALSNPGLTRGAMDVTGRALYRVAGQPFPEAPAPAPVQPPAPSPIPPSVMPGSPVSGPPVSAPPAPVSGPPATPPSRLVRYCTRCGSEILGEAKFCGQCGAAAPPHK
ncbi:zinc ribbon domain-containing protein [Phytomonospora sp. NPDC050363]|uniref:zinc ribbon domain-containing protein n=1 Tax=Phytomonospora sp. NPDC050363 TaxID=3155642 RepID=UPI00340E3AE0